jgi:hypothetical protein
MLAVDYVMDGGLLGVAKLWKHKFLCCSGNGGLALDVEDVERQEMSGCDGERVL